MHRCVPQRAVIVDFSIRNSSLISKVESRKLTGALDSCFVLFGTLQQCASTQPGGNRTRDLTVRKPVSNRCVTSARSRLEFSTSPINDIPRIIIHCLVCFTYIRRTWLALTLLINDEFLIENSNQIPYSLRNIVDLAVTLN